MKGSGIIQESSFGYKIGQRIKTVHGGGTSNSFGKNLGNYFAKVGDEGIITGVSKYKTEILYDNGEYGYRDEFSKQAYIIIIEEPKSEQYEIY